MRCTPTHREGADAQPERDEHPREAEERDERRDDQRAGQDREHDARVEQPEDATPQLVGQRPLQQRHGEHVDRGAARPGHDHQRCGDDRAVHQAEHRHRERGEADAREQRGSEAAARRQAVDQRRRDHPARPERAEQVAVAAGPGAEPLVRDEHEGDRLRAVDEGHRRAGSAARIRAPADRLISRTPSRKWAAKRPGSRWRRRQLVALVDAPKPEREQQRRGEERQRVHREGEHGRGHGEQRRADSRPDHDREVRRRGCSGRSRRPGRPLRRASA